jgi:hypothetical protein
MRWRGSDATGALEESTRGDAEKRGRTGNAVRRGLASGGLLPCDLGGEAQEEGDIQVLGHSVPRAAGQQEEALHEHEARVGGDGQGIFDRAVQHPIGQSLWGEVSTQSR